MISAILLVLSTAWIGFAAVSLGLLLYGRHRWYARVVLVLCLTFFVWNAVMIIDDAMLPADQRHGPISIFPAR